VLSPAEVWTLASLWATESDRDRLARTESVLFLVGGYDGSGNYGDVLQLASAIETASQLPASPLVVAVIEREMRGHHDELMRRYGDVFGEAAIAFFGDDAGEAEDDLVPLAASESQPASALVYLYGGGYLNGWWAGRKAAYVAAVEDLVKERKLPLVASGLQIEEEAVAPGGIAHDLLTGASWVGVRDAGSLEYLRRHIPSLTNRAELAGDDALPFLTHRPIDTELLVNLHVNDGNWISEEPESLRRRIVTLVRELGVATDKPLELQPVIAYEDPRISEQNILSRLFEQHRGELEGAGLTLAEPLDVLADAVCNGLATFRRARLTVSCSYHVTLTSLQAGIPAVLLAQNEYYMQKAAGLRDLFELEPGRVGVPGGPGDAAAAIEALLDSPARSDLVTHLQDRSRRVTTRFEQSRAALSAALADGLRQSALERQLALDRRRADAAEHELAAVHATRGWRLLNRLRALRRGFGSSSPAAPPAPGEVPAELREELARIGHLIAEAKGRGDYALEVARDMSLPTKMLAFSSWLELRPPASDLTLSVVLATRDRPRLLARAIPSVIAQSYERWQLVVVDDGTDPGTCAAVDAVDDKRVTLVEGPRRGLSAARNVGLDRASGEVVCYLDDDNVMHPGWLQAVAHVFSTRDDVDVAYGISLAEHRIPDDLGEHGWWPSFWQLPWARETLLEENVSDAGSLAHRRTLEEARFDEELSTGEDWDLLLRLTREHDALAIPALSHAYSMEGADRMSRDPQHRTGVEQIRRQHRDR
jgi:glycosyl transferase family 2/polysaccharide pyruvyl transferase